MRKLTSALTLGASAALALAATPVLAWNSWCDEEPPVTVVTPAGHHVTINNWISVPVQNRHLLKHMVVTGETAAGPATGTTTVHIRVRTPEGGSLYVHVKSSSVHYDQASTADGDWGSEIVLTLTLPES